MMNKEQFELLKQDLCSRLLHGVKIQIAIPFLEESNYPIEVLSAIDLKTDRINNTSILIDNVKPYLRPMSSMTEKESEKFEEFLELQAEYNTDADIRFKYNMFDWLNEHHFDYRGLIPMGLAIEAPEGMYNIK